VNNLKFGVLAFGLLGIIGCFLPMVSAGGQSISFFSMKELIGAGQVFMVMGGYGAALVMGAMAAAKPPMQRWQGIVAIVGFAFVVFKMRDGFMKLITDGAIGAKLMGISAIAGLVVAILCVAKPETAK
jgi:hypothetical protein